MERLIRNIEDLQLSQRKDIHSLSTVRINLCQSISEHLQMSSIKHNADYNCYFSLAVQVLFIACDDPDADIRLVANECLHIVFQDLIMEGNATLVHIELYREIKRNGASRSVQMALLFFGTFAPLIRPTKLRLFAMHLLPCVETLLSRPEDSLQEALGEFVTRAWVTLGARLRDDENKRLIRIALTCLSCRSASSRRSAVVLLVQVAVNARRPSPLVDSLFQTLLETCLQTLLLVVKSSQVFPGISSISFHSTTSTDTLSPDAIDQTPHALLGSLQALQQLWLAVHLIVDVNANRLLRLLIAMLHHIYSTHSSVISVALETLAQLLTSLPHSLVSTLRQPQCLHFDDDSFDFIFNLQLDNSSADSLLNLLPNDDNLAEPFYTSPEMGRNMPTHDSNSFTQSCLLLSNQESCTFPPDSEPCPSSSSSSSSSSSFDETTMCHPLCSDPAPPTLFTMMRKEGSFLQHCARLLTDNFLIPTKLIRVSVRKLALNCLVQVFNLDRSSPIEMTLILPLSEHDDPQIRSVMCSLVAACLKAPGNLPSSTSVQILQCTLRDNDVMCRRSAVETLKSITDTLLTLELCHFVAILIDTVLRLATDSYWLLKVSVAEFLAIHLQYGRLRLLQISDAETIQTNCLRIYVRILLGDDDRRVREVAASNLPQLVRNLCYIPADQLSFAHMEKYSFDNFSNVELSSFPPIQNMSFPYWAADHDSDLDVNIAVVLDEITHAFLDVPDTEMMSGCISGLVQLALTCPPTTYPDAWCLWSTVRNDQPLIGSVNFLLQLLRTSPIAIDLNSHQNALHLIGLLFAGQVILRLASNDSMKHSVDSWPLLSNSELAILASELLVHCLRIVNLYTHVLTSNRQSVPIAEKLSPQSISTSPVRKVVSGVRFTAKVEPPHMADFHLTPSLCRLLPSLQGAHDNWHRNVNEQRFSGLLNAAFETLNRLLEATVLQDIDKFVDELLRCLSITLGVLPAETVQLANQLLKALFGTNLIILDRNRSFVRASNPYSRGWRQYQWSTLSTNNHDSNFMLKHLFTSPTHDQVQQWVDIQVGWLGTRTDKQVARSLRDSTTKTTLTNCIRLFEPLVVEILRLYTSSPVVNLQRSVLALLCQLVQNRVNYSLLDTDHRFLRFILQQLDTIENGVFQNSSGLIPAIFELLLQLSYEHTKDGAIVPTSQLLQLCDSLAASDPRLAVLALRPITLDLFFVRPPDADLASHQEVIIALLLKQMHRPGAMHLLAMVIWKTGRMSDTAHWLRMSRSMVDRLLLLISEDCFPVESLASLTPYLFGLLWSCSDMFPTADQLISICSSVWEKHSDHDRLHQFLRICPCLFALLTLYDGRQLLSAALLGQRFLNICIVMSEELLIRTIDPSANPNGSVQPVLLWFMQLLCHVANLGRLHQHVMQFAVAAQASQAVQLLLPRLKSTAFRVHSQWLLLLDAVQVYQVDTWRHFVDDQSTLLIHCNRLMTWLNEERYETVLAWCIDNCHHLIRLSQKLIVRNLIESVLRQVAIGNGFLQVILDSITESSSPVYARRALSLVELDSPFHDVQSILTCCLRLLKSEYSIVAAMAESLFLRLAPKMASYRSLRHYLDQALAYRYRTVWTALHSTDDEQLNSAYKSIFSDEEQAELLPAGLPAKFNRLKFVRLLQSAIRRGYLYSWRSIAESVIICSQEEMDEILTTEGVMPELFLECLHQRLHLRVAVISPNEECPPTSCSSLITVGIVFLRHLARLLKDDNNGVVLCSWSPVLTKLLANRTSWTDQELMLLVSFVDRCLQHCSTGILASGLTIRVLKCSISVLYSSSMIDWLHKNKKIGIQLSIVNRLESVIEILLKINVNIRKTKQLPFELPERFENEHHLDASVRAWHTMESLLLYTSEDHLNTIKPRCLHSLCIKLILVTSRLPAIYLLIRTPSSAFRSNWRPTTIWDGHQLTLPPTPVHYLQQPPILSDFIDRSANVDGRFFEEVWLALLGVLSATPVGVEMDDGVDQLLASRIAVDFMTVMLLKDQQMASIDDQRPNLSDLSRLGRRLAILQANLDELNSIPEHHVHRQFDNSRLSLERVSAFEEQALSGTTHSDDEKDANMRVLLDLFAHWLHLGVDTVPLTLLVTTIRSMVMLSSLFDDISQYRWMRTELKNVWMTRGDEDQAIFPLLIFGLLKCIAVLGLEEHDGTKELHLMLSMGLKSCQSSTRTATLQGLLCVLQSVGADELLPITSLVVDFLISQLDATAEMPVETSSDLLNRPQCLFYRTSVWTTAWMTVSVCTDQYYRQLLLSSLLVHCRSTLASSNTVLGLLNPIVTGLGRLLLESGLDDRLESQIGHLVSDCLRHSSSPQHTNGAVRLLLCSLYSRLDRETSEPQLSVMEQLDRLFTKLSSGTQYEADTVSTVLPWLLVDSFSPTDLMNRVLSELLVNGQHRPRTLLNVFRQLFSSLRIHETPAVVADWALLSLPSFWRNANSVWLFDTVPAFLTTATVRPWIGALFPLFRDGFSDPQLKQRVFIFLITDLRDQLHDINQLDNLRHTLVDASKRHDHQTFSICAALLREA